METKTLSLPAIVASLCCLVLGIVIGGVLVGYSPMVLHAQGGNVVALSNQANKQSATKKAEPAKTFPASIIGGPTIVNLPLGQHFMYIIPAIDAKPLPLALGEPGQDVYVTYETHTQCGYDPDCPRKIRFLQSSGQRGAWHEVLWIQER